MKIVSVKKKKLDEPKQFYDVINAHPYNNFLIKTNNSYVCSHNCNFSDEVNWGITNDTEKLKKKYKQLVSQIDARMKSRFMRQRGEKTYLPTLNIIASSKNNEQSFLEDYIQTKKKNESTNTLIVDEPQWVVDSRKDSATKFFVAIGNRFLSNELLPLTTTKEELSQYRAKGYSILEVPIGYLENFKENIDGALMDIAGVATASSLKYISGVRWEEIKKDTYKNLFVKDVIEVGTGDDLQYKDFVDLSRVPSELKAKPLFIHLDMSTGSKGKGDKTGIGGVWVLGKRPKVEGESSSKELYFKVAFSVSVKAPKGFDISFDKNRQFIRWLREQGFNIKGVSSDTFMAAQIQQQLSADRFNVSTVSVDRLDSQTHQCLPYAYFKSTLYDKRVEVYKDCELLTEEVLGLERESDGHINHPENGTQGSKDQIDGIVGSLWNASQFADEFAYEYGETLETLVNVNLSSEGQIRQQLTVDFEEELKKLMMENHLPKNNDNGLLVSNNIPEAKQVEDNAIINIANGILVW